MKKAQGISMNVIIIATIALLVLVISSVIFIGRTGQWGVQVSNCISKGGQCLVKEITTPSMGCNTDYPTPYPAWSCEKTTEVCCINIDLG